MKNAHAVALGRLGGKATRESLDAATRSENAREAAVARWERYGRAEDALARFHHTGLIDDWYIKQDGQCITWEGATSGNPRFPHGRVRVGDKIYLPYRWLWIQKHGLISRKMHLHHVCQNPRCIRLDHLELLTCKEHFARHPRLIRWPKINK